MGRCFNEAGAIKPRKTGRFDPVSGPPYRCFNEAGAIKPRKTRKNPVSDPAADREASMRPGQSSPGKRLGRFLGLQPDFLLQ